MAEAPQSPYSAPPVGGPAASYDPPRERRGAQEPSERPSRLMRELPTDDFGTTIGPLVGALAAVAVVLVAAALIFIAV